MACGFTRGDRRWRRRLAGTSRRSASGSRRAGTVVSRWRAQVTAPERRRRRHPRRTRDVGVRRRRIAECSARTGDGARPRHRVDRPAIGQAKGDPIRTVSECHARSVDVCGEVFGVDPSRVAREHCQAVRLEDDASVDRNAAVIRRGDRPTAEIDASRLEVAELDPLALLVRNRSRIDHELVDHDARHIGEHGSASCGHADTAVARDGCAEHGDSEQSRGSWHPSKVSLTQPARSSGSRNVVERSTSPIDSTRDVCLRSPQRFRATLDAEDSWDSPIRLVWAGEGGRSPSGR